MKAMLHYFGLSLGLGLAAVAVQAGRISEPDTTFYGRVVSRTGMGEFPVTRGELTWTIAIPSQTNRQYQLKASLESLGGGRYSYRLSIPHQALAYDLSVSEKYVPLTAAGLPIRHLKVLVNGIPAVIEPPATDSFTAQQATRASAYRVDLVLPDLSADSDGDGAPDWWEDQNGFDKWDPRDGPAALSKAHIGGSTTDATGAAPKTLAEWRTAQFPSDTSDLGAFAREDRNGDGIPHLLDYAFALDPHDPSPSAESRRSLPHTVSRDGAFAVMFTKRPSATDLDYVIEVSPDLLSWGNAVDEVEQLPLTTAEQEAGSVCFRDKRSSSGPQLRFFRVRVAWKP